MTTLTASASAGQPFKERLDELDIWDEIASNEAHHIFISKMKSKMMGFIKWSL